MSETCQLCIDGQWRPGSDGATMPAIDPLGKSVIYFNHFSRFSSGLEVLLLASMTEFGKTPIVASAVLDGLAA